ncbi:glutathione S-transferase [Pigmentiphaga sp. NML080357]|uniref:glutathione S-transferase family protein n=1 Tax=Pigmentiphaga sp. NML080357 TaxID=2008675 RepID=UPI000B422029|nr:glutathione S-transferase N-terminal domain-containing protein [Pigmentiphaga sp. NML080357]OVZ64799.1 glutathione S-transferase [Pigmentiphaga sp. NML080357]
MTSTAAITLYTADTPNGLKINIFLQEAGVSYTQVGLDLGRGEQHRPEYLAINPNGKIPAITDADTGVSVFESGAILTYLANKYGRFSSASLADGLQIQQWLYFQVAGIGPMLGQLWWFMHGSGTRNEEALARYRKESHRLYGVVERRLQASRHLALDDYSIADMAAFPWLRTHDELALDMTAYPAVRQWLAAIEARPAVQRALIANRIRGRSEQRGAPDAHRE